MSHGSLAPILTAFVPLLATESPAADDPWIGREATRSRITIIDLDGSSPKVVLDSPHRYAAPEWTPDGAGLIVNGGGRLWRLPVAGGTPTPIATGSAGWIDINHAVSPDGKSLAFTAGPIWKSPPRGGEPARLTAARGTGSTPGRPTASGSPSRPTAGMVSTSSRSPPTAVPSAGSRPPPAPTTPPSISPDGRWIYFLSDRAGTRDIWRMPAAGAGAGDAKAEQITGDDRDDASPHPSPDGKWLIYLSYPPRTGGNAVDRDVLIRRLPLSGGRPARAKPQDIARVVGGHGTLGARPFAPDGQRLAYASFEPPPPTIRIILFTPSDRTPPAGVPHRLTQIADATERFLFGEMKRWNYPPAVARLFRRNPDGTVEVIYVKGDRPASDPFYSTRPGATPRPGRRPSGSCGSRARGTSGGSSSTSAIGRSGSATGAGIGCRPRWRHGDRQLRHDPRRDPPRPRSGDGLQRRVFPQGDHPRAGPRPRPAAHRPRPALGLGNSLMGPNTTSTPSGSTRTPTRST